MEEYVKKTEVLAEIKRRYEFHKERNRMEDLAIQDVLYGILNFIDTIEVKDEDSFDATVCKIGSTYLKEMDKDAIIKALEPYKDGDKVKVIIKAQEGE